MTPPETIQPEREQRPPPSPPSAPPAQQPKHAQQRTVQVPYSPTGWALLQGAFPMSAQDWDSMISVLQSMKVGLVAPPGDNQRMRDEATDAS